MSPTPPGKRRRVRCPYCARLTAVTPRGYLYKHLDPETKKVCARSKGSPN